MKHWRICPAKYKLYILTNGFAEVQVQKIVNRDCSLISANYSWLKWWDIRNLTGVFLNMP